MFPSAEILWFKLVRCHCAACSLGIFLSVFSYYSWKIKTKNWTTVIVVRTLDLCKHLRPAPVVKCWGQDIITDEIFLSSGSKKLGNFAERSYHTFRTSREQGCGFCLVRWTEFVGRLEEGEGLPFYFFLPACDTLLFWDFIYWTGDFSVCSKKRNISTPTRYAFVFGEHR